jgi:hypothetical protein
MGYEASVSGTLAMIGAMAVTRSRCLANDEYAAGFEDSTAKVWVNGLHQALTDGTHEAEALGIFGVP